MIDRIDPTGQKKQLVRMIGRSLQTGGIPIIGLDVDEVGEVASVVG